MKTASRTSRRSLFAGAAALSVASAPALAATLPDAPLIALCREIVNRERSVSKGYADAHAAAMTEAGKTAAWEAMSAGQDCLNHLVDEVARITPLTDAGRSAKAEVVRCWIGVWADDFLGVVQTHYASPYERLVWSLADDLAGRAGA